MNLRKDFSFGFHQLDFTNDSETNKLLGDMMALSVFSIFICIFGLVGNGIFLWLLTFSIKRNNFTIYLLNLSTNSIGLLIHLTHVYIFIIVICVTDLSDDFGIILAHLHMIMHLISRLILTAIGTDRCVLVLFPNWYRSHMSPKFPTVVCFLIWLLSFFIFGLLFFWFSFWGICVILSVVVIISTVSFLVKVCRRSQLQQRGVLTVVLLTLPLFLLVDVCLILHFFGFDFTLLHIAFGDTLVVSVNPVIYFLVGRWKGTQLQDSLKVNLQRIFIEEEPAPATHNQQSASSLADVLQRS